MRIERDFTPPHEPSADMRMCAAGLRSMYLALVAEGFTEDQAMRIIGYAISPSGSSG